MLTSSANPSNEPNLRQEWRDFVGKNSGQMFQLALLLLKDEHAAEAVLTKGLDDLAFERAPQYSDIKSWEHAVLEQSIKLLYLPAGGGGQFG